MASADATQTAVPAHLGAQGKRLWRQIVSAYKLRPDEVRLLVDACREADLVERLEVELRDSPLMVKGSQGQLVASPLVSEVRQHRVALSGLLRALKLPDSDQDAQTRAAADSDRARAAARARWDRRKAR